MTDIANALTNSLPRDGQAPPTANIPMGNFKLTGLSAGSTSGDSVRFEQLFSQGMPIDIASAATVDIGGQNTSFLNITGTTTITSFGTNFNGPRFVKFSGSLTLTNDNTTLVLPKGANIITQPDDVAILVPKSTISGTSDGWRVSSYLRAENVILRNDQVSIASAANLDFTLTQSQLYSITGTVNVTSVTMYEAQPVFAIAAAAFKLVNSTGLILPGGVDHTCNVNDVLCFIKDGAGNIHVSILNQKAWFTSYSSISFTSGATNNNGASPVWIFSSQGAGVNTTISASVGGTSIFSSVHEPNNRTSQTLYVPANASFVYNYTGATPTFTILRM